MPTSYVADSSALVALVSVDDQYHPWIVAQAKAIPWPWLTCEAVLSESFHIARAKGAPKLRELLRRGAVTLTFDLGDEMEAVLALMDKYADVPMSLADACLVRMTEILADPVVITTDSHFRLYRRHSRQVIPCLMP